ncbi:VOC family protein [Chloroflexota bacterium]
MKGDNMGKTGAVELPFSRVDQVGVIVRDMDEAVKHYQSLGIGPFEFLKNLFPIERRALGKLIGPDTIKTKVRIAQMGPVQLELVQPIEGKSLWMDFLDTKGEGINHLGFFVDNIDRKQTSLVKKGITVLYSLRFQNGGGAAYFDTGMIGGILLELIQWPPE